MLEILLNKAFFRQRNRFVGKLPSGYNSVDDIDWRVEDPEPKIINSSSGDSIVPILKIKTEKPIAQLPKSKTVFEVDLPQAA